MLMYVDTGVDLSYAVKENPSFRTLHHSAKRRDERDAEVGIQGIKFEGEGGLRREI